MDDNSGTTNRRTRADALERARKAYELRVSGATWSQIAEAAGYSDRSSAHHSVTRFFAHAPQPDRDDLRLVWRDRLEMLWRSAMCDVTAGRPGAIRAAVALAQRAAALDGLDEPSKATLFAPTEREIDALVGEVIRARANPNLAEADIFADNYAD